MGIGVSPARMMNLREYPPPQPVQRSSRANGIHASFADHTVNSFSYFFCIFVLSSTNCANAFGWSSSTPPCSAGAAAGAGSIASTSEEAIRAWGQVDGRKRRSPKGVNVLTSSKALPRLCDTVAKAVSGAAFGGRR